MQKLYFEPAWDRTIAQRDRNKITKMFQEQAAHIHNGIHLSFLWNALNHKGERLVTVLIHNREETASHLQETVITYYEHDRQIATGTFSLPSEIAGKTTMPWTFIFAQSNQTDKPSQYNIINEALTDI